MACFSLESRHASFKLSNGASVVLIVLLRPSLVSFIAREARASQFLLKVFCHGIPVKSFNLHLQTRTVDVGQTKGDADKIAQHTQLGVVLRPMSAMEELELLESVPKRSPRCSSINIVLAAIILGVAITCLVIVPLGGRKQPSPRPNLKSSQLKKDPRFWGLGWHKDPYDIKMHQDLQREIYIREKMINGFNADNMRANLRHLTRNVHVAGTKENLDVAQILADTYKSYGFEVQTHEYEVFLTHPDYKNPNKIFFRKQKSSWEVISEGLSKPLGPPEAQEQQSDPKAPILFNGYSAEGVVSGRLVYANHGTREDYQYLDRQNISLKDSIVLCRYGGLSRGLKILEAENRGAVGVIIYSDPQDYGPSANDSAKNVFPDSIYLPPEGAQRGGTRHGKSGDLLTPHYPSKPYVYRSTDEETARNELTIPKVPVMPIGYADAKKIFDNMDGQLAPKDFVGGIRGATYRLTSKTTKFKLDVRSKSDHRAQIKNVCAYLRGTEETDRLVIFSNHFDAWTFGSFDPNSGTSVMLEMGRVVMSVANETGWRPRRTMALCQWDAEEHGLIGSNEWIEEFQKLLNGRAVGVINMDIAVTGNVSLSPKGVPLMYWALVEATKHIPNPNQNELKAGRKTVYDSWLNYLPDPSKSGFPKLDQAGSGSDHYPFMASLGVPVVDYTYVCGPKINNCYNFYHSMYEVSWTMEHLVDTTFKVHEAMGRLSLELGRSLADSVVIPFNVTNYAEMLQNALTGLDSYLQQKQLDYRIPDYDTVIGNLRDAAVRFRNEAKRFQNKVDKANAGKDTISLREKEMLNRRLTELDRSFINPRGLYPGREDRHVVFASSIHDNYAGTTFPGVRDTAEYFSEAMEKGDEKGAAKWLKLVQIGLTDIQYSIESALLVIDLGAF